MKVPILKTVRLKFEPLSLEHSDGMFELWSNKKVTEFSGIVSDHSGNIIDMPAKSKNESDLIIDFWLKALDEGKGFCWAVILLESNKFIGIIGFNSLSKSFEIAYHLIPKFWGMGFMTEAFHAAIDWSKTKDAKTVDAYIEPENKASIALALRIGMVETSAFENGARKYQKML